MPDLWKEVASWLAEATRSAIKETEDIARRGRLKVDVLGINTALQDKFAALGGILYSIAKEKRNSSTIFREPRVRKLLEEIAELEISLKEAKKGDAGIRTDQVNQTPTGKKGIKRVKQMGKRNLKRSKRT